MLLTSATKSTEADLFILIALMHNNMYIDPIDMHNYMFISCLIESVNGSLSNILSLILSSISFNTDLSTVIYEQTWCE